MKNKLLALYFMWGAYALALIIWIIILVNSGTEQKENIIINIVFFLIVSIVFLYSTVKFHVLNNIVSDLKHAMEIINYDYGLNDGGFLWEKNDFNNHIFNNNKAKELKELYQNYIDENNRLNKVDEIGVYADIENYINYNVIDSISKKNVLNIVSSIMTGLGILGTFIGLTLGLRNFNTGSTEEIANSIAPLMNGIKVAFHTSIYGMILSLFYSFGFKHDIEIAYDTVDKFLDVFKSKVLPNPEANRYKMLVQYQKQQAKEITSIAEVISAKLSESITETITETMSDIFIPQFDKMNGTIENFADVASRTQVDGVGIIVKSFVSEMNKSLGDSFGELSDIIKGTCEWQKKNVSHMQDILNKVSDMTTNIEEINNISVKTIEKMSEYIDNINNLQKDVIKNMIEINTQTKLNSEMTEKQQGYIEKLVDYEKAISETSKIFSSDMVEHIAKLNEMEDRINSNTLKCMENLKIQSLESTKAISEAAQNQIENIINISNSAASNMDSAAKELGNISLQFNERVNTSIRETFELFDKELSQITMHLSGTIAEVDSTTGKVPKVVLAAYDGMKQSFGDMMANVDNLVSSIETLRVSVENQAILMNQLKDEEMKLIDNIRISEMKKNVADQNNQQENLDTTVSVGTFANEDTDTEGFVSIN